MVPSELKFKNRTDMRTGGHENCCEDSWLHLQA
ncbi:unnamed protein product [Nippostrongylus brasiliensis]|uniref:Uncharacterized protein n=1 Tax=Nippostrongylus brasiliensis TaxID=27835 RepID=A0A0N4Y3K6_NIPBR|nr:unnamed protein product [Nippostrongylus brasiliensis]